MRLALREMRRRPGRFLIASVILTLIALLLMFLGGLLDGLLASTTGAYRAQQADLIVYSPGSGESLVRSRITPEVRAEVEQVERVDAVGALTSVQLGARPEGEPDTRDLMPVALFGYDLAPSGLPEDPPGPGEVVADSSLRADGVEQGDTLLLGSARSPVRVLGFVDDTRYAGQASLWGSVDTWRTIAQANRPGRGEGDTVQALVVLASGDGSTLAPRIDEATGGATESLTVDDAIGALPGVEQQQSTFNQIIGLTIGVALVVVALFFALITLERTALYGVLKALGGSSGWLFAGVVVQALVVTLVASALGLAGALVADAAIPPGTLPFELTVSRAVISVLLMVVAAVAGCAFSLRRVLRVEPASAIGTAS